MMTVAEAKVYLQSQYAHRGMTQAEVALEVLHIAPSTLSRYTSGVLAWPADVIVSLVEYFHIPKVDIYDVFLTPHVNG